MENVSLTCPYCNAKGSFAARAESKEYHSDHYILECLSCARQIYARVTYEWTQSEPHRRGRRLDVDIYPKGEPPTDPRIPPSIAEDYREAVQSFDAAAYRACVLMCRRVLQGVASDRKAPGKLARVRLGHLARRGVIAPELLERLRQVGLLEENLDPGLKALSPGDAELALRFTEELLYHVYVEGTPARPATRT